MKLLIKLEEVGLLALSIFLMYRLGVGLSWWLYLLLFFSPDIGMAGYIINTKVGAFTYNLIHHKGIAALILLLGIYLENDYIILAALLLFAHAAFDRICGYGLKYEDGFKHTSLGFM